MKDLYNLMDQQLLLSLLMTWEQIHESHMDTALRLPDNWNELEEPTPAEERWDSERELLTGIEMAARNLISWTESAGLISTSEWSVLNAIICNIGTDDPDTAARLWWRDWEYPYDPNPPFEVAA